MTRSNQSGFTAVELLITLFVAAAFLVAGYQLFDVVIKDGGKTRAESRASNVAYDYLRRYTDSSTANPCVVATPLTNSAVTVSGLLNPTITVTVSCPQVDAPAVNKVETTITYSTPGSTETVKYATFVDKSRGASPNNDFTDSLIAQWRLNGNGQASVGGVNAAVFGATPTTNRAGVQNMAYSFDAAAQNQYLDIPSTFGLTDRNVSISAWVNITTASSSGQFFKVGDTTGGFGLGVGGTNIDNATAGTKLLGVFEGVRVIDPATNLGTGWHQIAMVLSTTGVPTMYLDGASLGSSAGTNATAPNGNKTNIGGRTNRWSQSSIDDARIYNRTLTTSEVLQIYNNGPK